MAQLLMVDPSAWTRWTKSEDQAPPHIWRALQWYMIVQEKVPGLTAQYFIGKDPQILHLKALNHIELEKKQTSGTTEFFASAVFMAKNIFVFFTTFFFYFMCFIGS